MKNLKALAMLALAVLIGLAAALYAARWAAQRTQVAANKVVVAAVDIELGSRINPQMLTTVEWPAGSIPPGAFTDLAELQDRVVKVAILRGDAILDRKLAPPGTKGGLSAVITEGKRAMTVRVNDVVGVAGFALPGNYVDVMINAQQDRGRGDGPNQVSMTVLQQVLVLAVAQEASRDDLKPKVVSAVTLEVTPEQAEKLDLARSVGTLSLVLRNQLDKDSAGTNGITRAELLGLKEVSAHPAPKPAAPVRTVARSTPKPAPVHRDCVEVIRNASSSMHCF
ncbi:Flp pilus assembly protein CpaB [Ramlibacter tataouinensis]|uniref:Flp pilus assembly protein CpaB n=1 Tax=Ramlibacter tataouinensis TaxID=94132 RepID=UPI0022F3F427|nr:Flp pilus assembly protein CpaB [Ramlibacter tataouinensis]WBY02598.1 Flp pilus assembly protein CpaB [Ramlibacter tataouinensis]